MNKQLVREQARLLFVALAANGTFSLLCGLVMVAISEQVAAFIGFSKPGVIMAVGGALVMFGSILLFHAWRGQIRVIEAWGITASDFAWVLGSVLLLVLARDLFNQAGFYTIIAIALLVMTFAELQVLAILRTRKQPALESGLKTA